MKVCVPVKSDQGLDSPVYDHFGSAPFFIIFDSETSEVQAVQNDDKQHEHGACNPLLSFQSAKPEIVVVGGIGDGALSKLIQDGIRVFKAEGLTVKDNIEALTSKGLPEFSSQHTCHGHENGHGCGCSH